MANLGWTPAMIDEAPAHDVFVLLAWWREHPPTAEILAAVHRVVPTPLPDPDDPSGIGPLIRGGASVAPRGQPMLSETRSNGGTLAEHRRDGI